jgi:heptaprenylglyceryl phosphate synthase
VPDYEAIAKKLNRAANTLTEAYSITNPTVRAAALTAARTQVDGLLTDAVATLRAE